jgi:hypothetical protein
MSFGADRLIEDLSALGYKVEKVTVNASTVFAVILDYEVMLGKFAGRIIDLGHQATPNFPQNTSSAIHVRANPQLYDFKDTVPNIRNISQSALGAEWRYWSHNFNWTGERSARRLMSQINTIFQNAS